MTTTAARLLAALRARHESLATAESLTGGGVAAELTAVPGSSEVFRGGVVTYATDVKNSLAGVPTSVTDGGVVTEATALAMANGARLACQADWGLATTGVAGPGPSDGVAAGTVWVAVVGPAVSLGRSHQFAGGRAAVRAASTAAVLRLAVEILSDEAPRDVGFGHD